MDPRARKAGLALALLAAAGAIALLALERGAEPAPESVRKPLAHPRKSVDPTRVAPAGDAPAPGATRPADPVAPAAPAANAPAQVPLQADGRVDFAALGLTGDEPGAELLRSNGATVERAWSAPELVPGDAWEVETYYRLTQAGRGDQWSQPHVWRFEVERKDAFQGEACLVVKATLLEAGAPSELAAQVLYLSPQGRLLGAELTHVRGGKGKAATSVAGGPADAASSIADTIVPCELPAPGTLGQLERGGASLVALEPLAPSSPRPPFPERSALLGAGGDYLVLSWESPRDGTRVSQRWSVEDPRWPAETITEHWRSYRRG